MKRYLVKAVAKATTENIERSNEVQVYYIGKENYTRNNIDDFNHYEWITGWSNKRWAKKYIEDSLYFHKRIPNKFWDYEYEIVEYDCRH